MNTTVKRRAQVALLLCIGSLGSLGLAGCEAIAKFDRGQIPGRSVDAGHLSDASTDAATDAQPGDDAGSSMEAGFDASQDAGPLLHDAGHDSGVDAAAVATDDAGSAADGG